MCVVECSNRRSRQIEILFNKCIFLYKCADDVVSTVAEHRDVNKL